MSFERTATKPIDPLLQKGLEAARNQAGSHKELVVWQTMNRRILSAFVTGELGLSTFRDVIKRQRVPAGCLFVRDEADFETVLGHVGIDQDTVANILNLCSEVDSKLRARTYFGVMALTVGSKQLRNQSLPTQTTAYYPAMVPFPDLESYPSEILRLRPVQDPAAPSILAVSREVLPERLLIPTTH